MVANQTKGSRLEQRTVTKFLMAEKYKPCEVYRRMCDMYREVGLNKKEKVITNWLNMILPL